MNVIWRWIPLTETDLEELMLLNDPRLKAIEYGDAKNL